MIDSCLAASTAPLLSAENRQLRMHSMMVSRWKSVDGLRDCSDEEDEGFIVKHAVQFRCISFDLCMQMQMPLHVFFLQHSNNFGRFPILRVQRLELSLQLGLLPSFA